MSGSRAPGAPRPVGRPRDPRKAEAIVDASWRLFLAKGVAAVTVDAIAREAGVSKGTMYGYFPDKHALFAEGVRRETRKIEAAQAVAPATFAGASLTDVLVAFGVGIMSFLTSDGAVDFYNSLSGELRRDPALARHFYDAGPGRTRSNLAAILASPLAAGLEIADANVAAETLFGIWQGFSNYQLALGIERAAIIAAIPARVDDGVRRFLRAYAPAP